MEQGKKPLAGLKVIDFTRVFAGPYCTMLLADLGADVVKVEMPGEGDPLRTQGPPFHHGLGITYLAANRNKRSLTLDMGTAEGKQIAFDLCKGADVLVENFRPGVMPRLGLAYEELKKVNPRLVYASISGMGADGPDKDLGAFDLTIQAIGGYMSITGERGGAPIKLGTSAFDMIAGMNCQTAVLAALLERATTGAGQKVETSLLEGEVAFLANAALEYMLTGKNPQKWGSEHAQQVPYKAFETADGWAIIGAGYQNIWMSFLGVIGREDLQQDPRFADLAGRVSDRDALYEILDAEVRKHRTSELIARLDAAKVPCAPVNNMEQVFSHRQVLHRGMLRPVEHPSYGTLPQVGPASKYSSFRVEEGWTAPPLLGEHSEEVLREWLGLPADSIEQLRNKRII
ncbi:MAG: formyl-CoA transferase [Variovorax paradoxus]|uniref:Formyl-CoA transferase n=1 Tax=Variovorax paradoxus TaxID=34073 RepID=A0A2W5QM42_VARPD|nr:MAG: formyl-CoA transferase [Variovorax paradoxus]